MSYSEDTLAGLNDNTGDVLWELEECGGGLSKVEMQGNSLLLITGHNLQQDTYSWAVFRLIDLKERKIVWSYPVGKEFEFPEDWSEEWSRKRSLASVVAFDWSGREEIVVSHFGGRIGVLSARTGKAQDKPSWEFGGTPIDIRRFDKNVLGIIAPPHFRYAKNTANVKLEMRALDSGKEAWAKEFKDVHGYATCEDGIWIMLSKRVVKIGMDGKEKVFDVPQGVVAGKGIEATARRFYFLRKDMHLVCIEDPDAPETKVEVPKAGASKYFEATE